MENKFEDAYDRSKIRNRLRTLKGHYYHIKTFVGLDGFGWDDVTKSVTASEEVWNDFIKAHPEYEFYRHRNSRLSKVQYYIWGFNSGWKRFAIDQSTTTPSYGCPQANNIDVEVESCSSEKRGANTSKAPPRKRSRVAVCKNEDELIKDKHDDPCC